MSPTHAAPRRAPVHPCAPAAGYLMVPVRLLHDLQDTPLAVGVWSLISRLHLISREPVPISASDIIAFDPSLARGAVVRAVTRLTAAGWLAPSDQPGWKTCYTPTWGIVAGVRRAWDWSLPALGRPRHRTAIRIDQRLLDTYLGRLTPHPRHAADIRRYVSRPLLTLADVGAYALAAIEVGPTTSALCACGLARDGLVRPVPSDAEILARASQLVIDAPDAPTLSTYGLTRLGFTPQPCDSPPEPGGQSVVYVDPAHVGGVIANLPGALIGQTEAGDAAPTATQREETPCGDAAATATWNPRNHQNQRNSPLPPDEPAGGGASAQEDEGATASALRALGVRPAVVTELAELPSELVSELIRAGQQRTGIRDLAAWVVSMAREARTTGRRPRLLGHDAPVDWGAIKAEAQASGLISAEDDAAEAVAETEEEPAPVPAEELPERLAAELHWRLPVAHRARARDLQLRCEGGMVTIVAPWATDPRLVDELAPAFVGALRALGRDTPPRFEPPRVAPVPVVTVERRPAWIAPERWAELPVMVRGALAGATCAGGRITAASAYAERLLETRYAAEVDALVAEQETGNVAAAATG